MGVRLCGTIELIMRECLVSETIKPVAATCDTTAMAAGGPGLPREFVWRGKTVEVTSVIAVWRETGRCRHGSPERYVRKHWFEVETTAGRMKIYFERQPRRGKARRTDRWWLFSISGGHGAASDAGDGRERIYLTKLQKQSITI